MTVSNQSAYGYFSDDVGPLTSVMEGSVQTNANTQEVMTLLEDNGISDGTTAVKVSLKHAMKKGVQEPKRLLLAHLNKQYVNFTYAVDDIQVTVRGKISSTTLGSGVNKANTFDLEFAGFVQSVQ